MSELPLVSVIAVCYNHAKYVLETLDSIKNQTYLNLELIIMDDCSTDNSVEVIQNWITKNDYDCQFIAHQKNQGLCKTLNEAVEFINGKYTQIIACDDVLIKNKFQNQVDALEKTDDSTLLCCSNYSHIDKNSEVIKEYFFKSDFDFPSKTFEAILSGSQGYGIIVHSPTVLLKSSVFYSSNNYPESIIQEDLYMWLKITFDHKAIYIDDVLVRYRILSSSLSKAYIYKERMFMDRILVGSLFLKYDISIRRKKVLIEHNNRYLKYFLKEKFKNIDYTKFVLNKISINDYLNINERCDVKLMINKTFKKNIGIKFFIFKVKRSLEILFKMRQKLYKLLKKLSFRRYYFIDKQLYFLSHKTKKTPICIYTMGKVGSTSIYESLKEAYSGSKIYNVEHLHRLNESYLSKRESYVKKEIYKDRSKSKHLYESLVWKPLKFKKNIKLRYDLVKWITIIREPVKRNISVFFQWLDFEEKNDSFVFKSRNHQFPFLIETPKEDISELIDYFINKFDHGLHLKWLDEELNEVLGVNYLDIEFDHKKDYAIADSYQGNSNLLILKLESLDKTFGDSMNEFLEIQEKLLSKNEAKNKDLGDVYKVFNDQIKFPKDYLDKLYSSNYVKKFYSNSEIENFYSKWIKE